MNNLVLTNNMLVWQVISLLIAKNKIHSPRLQVVILKLKLIQDQMEFM